tara:strand:+ start:3013 stop:3888 length:876 start_codon:yes stop_codon:yes gene_type:complete
MKIVFTQNPKEVEFPQSEQLDQPQSNQLKQLRDFIRSLNKVCIAYSGGVDSTLVAAIASEQLGQNALAITGISESLAPHLRQEARQQANWIGINYEECLTNEINNPNYFNNPENRCFTCKQELHNHLQQIAALSKGTQVVDGVNHDDLNDYRPGIKAAKLAGVISPLAELKISKSTVREISKSLGFPWWDKPAQPCLASRIPYGEVISSKRLQQIAKAEKLLISKGFKKVRVRVQGLGARIELPSGEIQSFIQNVELNEEVVKYFISIGFTSVSLDLEGLVSGKLNRKKEL